MEIKYENVKHFAERIDLPQSTVREMCRKGELPSTKMGKNYVIDVAAACELIGNKIAERAQPKPVAIKRKPKAADTDNSFKARLAAMAAQIKAEVRTA